MGRRSKREVVEKVPPRYRKAEKSDKEFMLNEFVAATGYHCNYVTRLLKKGRPQRSNKTPPPSFSPRLLNSARSGEMYPIPVSNFHTSHSPVD